jgi:hypothetical protein
MISALGSQCIVCTGIPLLILCSLHGCFLQVSRPSKYHPDWGVLLGPTTPDPTINTSMLSINSGSGDGTPMANGGGEAPRKPANPNRLYISGLPYNWRTQHVSNSSSHVLP